MSSVNRVMLIGFAGKDAELRYTSGGAAVCSVSLATARSWKDKTSGERQEETEWHRVVFYDKLAEIAGEYVKKGSQIYVDGRLKTRKWTDKDGIERYTTEVIGQEMQLLGKRSGEGGEEGAGQRTSQARQQPSAPQRSAPAGRTAPQGGGRSSTARQPAAAGGGFDDGDDIPFLTRAGVDDVESRLERRMRRYR